jgi:hypothetical protein
MLVLQKAVRMVWELPDVMRVAYAFVLVMLCWMALWSFGVSGIVAMEIPNRGQWWLVLVRASCCQFQCFVVLRYSIIIVLQFAGTISQFILDGSYP